MISKLITPQWPCAPGVQALLTPRSGDNAGSIYGGFNLADHVGDVPSAVRANRLILRDYLSQQCNLHQEPVWLEQVHGNNVYVAVGKSAARIQADASYTNEAGRALVMLVADCLPILLCSSDGKEIAAIHAGWKGLANGIIEKTVAQFKSTEVLAWLGPSIGPCHYEVDVAVKSNFESDSAFAPGTDAQHWQFDLGIEAARQLDLLAVTLTRCEFKCTWCDDRFYSYRRDGVTGRFAALVWISP